MSKKKYRKPRSGKKLLSHATIAGKQPVKKQKTVPAKTFNCPFDGVDIHTHQGPHALNRHAQHGVYARQRHPYPIGTAKVIAILLARGTCFSEHVL